MQGGTEDESSQLDNAQDANHQIGILKKYDNKGYIQTLTENEILYIKTILK